MGKRKIGFRGWLLIIAAVVLASLIWDLFSNRQEKIIHSAQVDFLASPDSIKELDNSEDEADKTVSDHEAEKNAEKDEDVSQTEEQWPVYIVGAIKQPGIYKVEPGTCLFELVNRAGGLTPDAAEDRINLAGQVSKHQLIRIPTVLEWQENPDDIDLNLNHSERSSESSQEDEMININYADATELEKLPGIGPATAKTIIDYRNENGAFENIEDIMQVPGIKENRFAQLRDNIIAN